MTALIVPFLLPKNIKTFPGPQNVSPGRCRSTGAFKCNDKRQLYTYSS